MKFGFYCTCGDAMEIELPEAKAKQHMALLREAFAQHRGGTTLGHADTDRAAAATARREKERREIAAALAERGGT